ncbi:MAG TPA: sialidase family protein [Gaiellaceae bacterium]
MLPFVCLTMVLLTTSASANVPLLQIASDPFTNASSQHATIVGPDSFSFGSTIVAAAQAGRFFDDGASGIVYATSTSNGFPWTSGVLPGMTGFTVPPGPYARVSDPSVAYDAKHNVWLIASLALQTISGGTSGRAILISRSTDGGITWGNPVATVPPLLATSPVQNFDKPWIVCDNTPSSPGYGFCYTQWDDFGMSNKLKVAYSNTGGLPPWTLSPVPGIGAVGGQPLVLPNGNVVVVFSNVGQTLLRAVTLAPGGATFLGLATISTIDAANNPGAIRSDPLVSAEIAGDGTIYVVWSDCRYRLGCPSAGTPNDLVYRFYTSSGWIPAPWTTSPLRIPIDLTTPTDHFIPGVAVDRATSAPNIHVAVAYYFYPNVSCAPTCLDVGYTSSANGGSSWSPSIALAGPMTTSWLSNTTHGRMVGDYISTSFDSIGLAHPVFTLANPPASGSDQALYTPVTGLTVGGSSPTPSPLGFFNGSPRPNWPKR